MASGHTLDGIRSLQGLSWIDQEGVLTVQKISDRSNLRVSNGLALSGACRGSPHQETPPVTANRSAPGLWLFRLTERLLVPAGHSRSAELDSDRKFDGVG